MKRCIAMSLLVFLLQGAGPVHAMQHGTPEYEKIKAYKKSMHDKKAGGPVEKNFWQKEAERSGLAGGVVALGRIVGDAVPLQKPNANK